MVQKSGAALSLAAALCLALVPLVTNAGESSGTLAVTANVSTKCKVSAPTLAFGDYDPVGANANAVLDGTTTATFTCTRGATNVYVTADTGLNGPHATGSCAVAKCTRAMSDGSSHYLSYDLYTNAAFTNVWNTTNSDDHVFRPTFDTGNVATATVHGQIPAAENVPAGGYTDSVTMTINF